MSEGDGGRGNDSQDLSALGDMVIGLKTFVKGVVSD